jgi:hypothetical protein
MAGITLQLPKKVVQYKIKTMEQTKLTCWAAALESWMSVTPNSPGSWYLTTQDSAIDNFYMFMESNGGLEIQWGFRFMAAAVGMEIGVFKPSSKLSGSFIYSKLKSRGHIYLFYAGGVSNTSGEIGHCVVIYGINNPWDKNCTVSIMDPWFGEYNVDKPLSFFQNANESVAGWFEYNQ